MTDMNYSRNRARACKRFFSYFLTLILIIIGGCSSPKSQVLKIGIDPTWFPLDVINKEPYILAFSTELLQKIAQLKRIQLERVTVSWDNLLEGLNKKQYQGILSSLEPHVFNLEKYQFSENFLNTGPVLVMRENAVKSETDTFNEKEIAAFSQNDEQLLMQKYPDAFIRMYDSLQTALVDLTIGNLDAVLVDYLQAFSYVNDIYQNQLKIVSPPLNKEGLKLVTLAKEQQKLIQLFNEGLNELKKTGEYDELLKKWKMGS